MKSERMPHDSAPARSVSAVLFSHGLGDSRFNDPAALRRLADAQQLMARLQHVAFVL